MGNLFAARVGNILTALLGKVLTVGVGKVLDIYNLHVRILHDLGDDLPVAELGHVFEQKKSEDQLGVLGRPASEKYLRYSNSSSS